MKVLFANVPWHKWVEPGSCEPGWLGIRAGSRWPHTMSYNGGSLVSSSYLPFPFFLAYAGALAKQNGFNVLVRDSIAMGETYSQFYDFVQSYKPDIIVMETSTPSIYNDLEIAGTLKKQLPSAVIIFTGIHFELEQATFLKNHSEIDYIIYGEFEDSVNQLLKVLSGGSQGKSFEDVPNLVYRKGEEVIKNRRGALVDIQKLPWPEQDSLPYENYFDAVCGLDRPQLQILTTRGCPYGCIFCVWPQLVYNGHSYRIRTPQDVVNEIEANFAKHPYRSFYIDDDTFNINKAHVLGIASELKKRGLSHIPWGAMCRADLMTPEILKELKSAGLYSVKYGIESASQAVLDDIGKKLDLQKVVDVVRTTHDLGIKVHLTYTFGLPHDTEETIEKTIQLACDLPSDSVQFSIATPFPGTVMYEMYEQKGWITTKDWTQYDGAATAVSRTERFSGEQLRQFIDIAYRRSTEARIARSLQTSDFSQQFKERIRAQVPQGSRVLVLQCAVYTLTLEIIKLLTALGYDTHVMLHQRFTPQFKELVPVEKLHEFNNTTHFQYEALRDFAMKLRQQYHFAGAIVPYSNPNGGGYDEVKKVAIEASGKMIAGVTTDARIIDNELQ